MKKRVSLIAWLLLVSIVLTAFAGCEKKPAEVQAPSAQAPVQQTAAAAPANPAPAAPAALQHTEETGSLSSWELSYAVWSSSNGATVTLTAMPRAYEKGQSASFVVRLEGKEVENKSCDWDGVKYTASVDLEAADGYEYECVMFPAQGASEHYMLSDAYDSLVYLQTSLAAYCNLYISDYKVENGKFVVTAGFAYVQLPQLTVDGMAVGFDRANLVFTLNAEEIETQTIDLPKGEGAGSYEASLSAISFTMPQMDDDYQLDLMLSITLSNGEQLTANGGSWFYNNGELRMSAG